MRPLLIVDVETTGLDPETDRIIEVGAVLFDPEAGVPVACASQLISAPDNPVETINRIPAGVLQGPWCSEQPRHLLEQMQKAGDEQPIFVAHEAAFDSAFLDAAHPGPLADETWICTKRDVEWDRLPGGTGSLVKIALAYDVGVVRAHRAIEDCLTLAAILSKVHALEDGLENWIARALEPRVQMQALVSYNDRQLAKDRGFTWDGERKMWLKRVRVSALDAFRAEVPFRVQETA